jgi:hypothetical protein
VWARLATKPTIDPVSRLESDGFGTPPQQYRSLNNVRALRTGLNVLLNGSSRCSHESIKSTADERVGRNPSCATKE